MKVYVKGKEVLIDDEDLEVFRQYNWHINDSGYAVWRGVVNGKKQTIRLHRLIAKPPEGLIVDHINRNKLDNRRSNLRCVTQLENAHNTDRVENAKGYYYSNSKCRGDRHWVLDYKGHHATYLDENEAKKAVEEIKSDVFVKPIEKNKFICSVCGSKKEWYGGAINCRKCVSRRCAESYRRRVADGRIKLHPRQRKEYCLNGHPRTPENVSKNGTCKICANERRKNGKAKEK